MNCRHCQRQVLAVPADGCGDFALCPFVQHDADPFGLLDPPAPEVQHVPIGICVDCGGLAYTQDETGPRCWADAYDRANW